MCTWKLLRFCLLLRICQVWLHFLEERVFGSNTGKLLCSLVPVARSSCCVVSERLAPCLLKWPRLRIQIERLHQLLCTIAGLQECRAACVGQPKAHNTY